MSQPTIPLPPDDSPKRVFSVVSVFLALFAAQFAFGQNEQIPPPPPAQVVVLEAGKLLERRAAAGGAAQSFELRLNENQYARITIEQTDFDVLAGLFGADGSPVTVFNNEARLKENEVVEFVSARAGSYRVEVRAMSRGASGAYKVRLAEAREATARDRALFEAHSLYEQAHALQNERKYAEAVKVSARALALAEGQLGAESAPVGLILVKLGFLQMETADYAAAKTSLERALALNGKLLGAEHPQTVDALYALGVLARRTNDAPRAERVYRQVLEIYERTLPAGHGRTALAMMSLGHLLHALGDSAPAEKYLLRALEMTGKNLGADHAQTGEIVNNLGVVYLDRGDYDRAEQYFLKTLAVMEKTLGMENSSYSNVLQNLGIIYRNRKQYKRALETYERALGIRERSLGKGHPNVGFLLNNISNIYKATGDYKTALELQRRVREIAENSFGEHHGLTLTSIANTATLYAATGDFDNAVAFQKLWDERSEKVMTLELTIGSERQKLAYIDGYLLGRTSRTISLHLSPRGEETRAAAAADAAALAVLRRKGRVLDAVADNLASLRRRAGKDDLALLDRLSDANTQLAKLTFGKPAKMPPEEYRRQLALLEEQKEKLEREISDRGRELAAANAPPPVTLASVRAEIPPGAALVEFAVYRPFNPKAENNDEAYGEPRYIAYILRRQGEVRWADLGDQKTIDETIGEFRKALRDPGREDVRRLARAADEKLMRAVRALSGGAAQLLISPDGELNLIPFEALLDENGRYLVENYSVTYLTSGRDLLRMRAARANASEPLIVANPLFGEPGDATSGGGGAEPTADPKTDKTGAGRRSITAARNLSDTFFAPLGATTEEARLIRTQFPEARLLSGAEATESALGRVVSPRILHVATHGFFLENAGEQKQVGNPLLRSGIALAGANRRGGGAKDDGILTALEASGLNLWGTKLVVLSACDTGLGEVKNGEGVYGLRRAFVLAGTESLVMSLWPVSDYVTRQLMTDYYKNLKRGAGRGAALRQTQLGMLRKNDRRHPFYWAAFIHSGEWASLDGRRPNS